eukprot:6184441-Alexandrium_andersonii.AAC.1
MKEWHRNSMAKSEDGGMEQGWKSTLRALQTWRQGRKHRGRQGGKDATLTRNGVRTHAEKGR